jgi:hypothetical protein
MICEITAASTIVEERRFQRREVKALARTRARRGPLFHGGYNRHKREVANGNDEQPTTLSPSHIMFRLAAGPDGRSPQGGRKVRTPQSSVPDNVREAGFKPVRRKVPQRIYRPGGNARVRVKRCGKSAPPRQ